MIDFSSAAQAVLDAFLTGSWESTKDRQRLAAALRAAADQVVREFWYEDGDIYAETKHDVRADLLAIAAELEGTNE